MTNRENILSIIKRQGYEKIDPYFDLCPHLADVFASEESSETRYQDYFKFSMENIWDVTLLKFDTEKFLKFHRVPLKEGTVIDIWGVGHEKGSESAMHMTKMLYPLENAQSVQDIENYPFPDFSAIDILKLRNIVNNIKNEDKLSVGNMGMTIWECSWYIRGMENLMMDMMSDDEMATSLLDKVTEIAIKRAENFANAGVDVLFLGDDIGMQKTIMMSEEFYIKWLKPRLKKVIGAAKKVNPEIIIFYHSCGYVTPFIPHLIEVGVEVLNPVQPECMNFEEIHSLYGQSLSFFGTIGTQTTFPFGSISDVKTEVSRNLRIAGEKGGLIVAPTHMVEPEVPWENVKAYIEACKEFV